ncbi:sensor histidine kinase [Bacillus infantis]|uniref:sensor histidine kinase n=1 Tax=Bacillus infantis TaxID=324767 RepID=UPI001F0ECC86|nr:ATP-binding protein [Bacillus infantis]
MKHIKKYAQLLMSKLIAVNSLVIVIVILIAGLSVNNYACYLVNAKEMEGQEFVRTLGRFLIAASIIAFLLAGFVHYLSVRRILRPIQSISEAAVEINAGQFPDKITPRPSGEVGQLVSNFNMMAESLKSAQQQRDTMLRDISHELRTPLTNINGYLEALQGRVIEGNPELFGSLLEESLRITRIVELITELDRWERGNVFLEKSFEPVRLDEILSETISAFKLKLDDRFHEVHIHLTPFAMDGHRDGLKQVFTNMLQNIVDYDTGHLLAIESEMVQNRCMIRFIHQGEFIDPGEKELIFQRFYRLESSRTKKAEGAGLGLSISRKIAEAHGGEIGLETDGTHHTFWIAFPAGEHD